MCWGSEHPRILLYVVFFCLIFRLPLYCVWLCPPTRATCSHLHICAKFNIISYSYHVTILLYYAPVYVHYFYVFILQYFSAHFMLVVEILVCPLILEPAVMACVSCRHALNDRQLHLESTVVYGLGYVGQYELSTPVLLATMSQTWIPFLDFSPCMEVQLGAGRLMSSWQWLGFT